MSLLVRRPATLCLALAYATQVTGCTSWQPRTEPTPAVLATDGGKPLRVTLADGTQVTLVQARLVADTLVGLSVQGRDTSEVRLPQERIRTVEERQADGLKTMVTVLVTGGIVVGALAGVMSAMNDSCMPFECQ